MLWGGEEWAQQVHATRLSYAVVCGGSELACVWHILADPWHPVAPRTHIQKSDQQLSEMKALDGTQTSKLGSDLSETKSHRPCPGMYYDVLRCTTMYQVNYFFLLFVAERCIVGCQNDFHTCLPWCSDDRTSFSWLFCQEKFKILSNEVEILRMESAVKDMESKPWPFLGWRKWPLQLNWEKNGFRDSSCDLIKLSLFGVWFCAFCRKMTESPGQGTGTNPPRGCKNRCLANITCSSKSWKLWLELIEANSFRASNVCLDQQPKLHRKARRSDWRWRTSGDQGILPQLLGSW